MQRENNCSDQKHDRDDEKQDPHPMIKPMTKAYCSNAVLQHLRMLMMDARFDDQEKKDFLGMFSSDRKEFQKLSDSRTLSCSFWGFVRSETMKMQLIKFLNSALHVKMYLIGETRKNFIEGIMIVRPNRLCITRDCFEEWLDILFSKLKMSAGINIFTEYLGDQMLTSMERVRNSKSICSNITASDNTDFLNLFLAKTKLKKDQEYVLTVTGISFTAEEFVNVFHMAGGSFGRKRRAESERDVRNGLVRPIPLSTRLGLSERPLLNDLSVRSPGGLDEFGLPIPPPSEILAGHEHVLRAQVFASHRASARQFLMDARHDAMQSDAEHNYTILMRHTS